MAFHNIKIHNFRNLKNKNIIISGTEIFILGRNGQGKTNFIELIYMLCFGASFRTKVDKNICRIGQNEMKIYGEHSVPKQSISLSLIQGKKSIKMNEKFIKDRKDMIKSVPCITYCYEDMQIIKGAPEFKRRFLNQTLGLYDEIFIENFRNYYKILKNRNYVLKNKNIKLLDIYDYQLASLGQIIQNKRENLIKHFNKVLLNYFQKIYGINKKVEIKYLPSWSNVKSIEDIIKILHRKREADIIFKSTSTGPHRDKIMFSLRDKDYSLIASTGQIRLLSLIIKSAQAEFYYLKTKKKPILLFDDVLVELDYGLKTRFLKFLPFYNQAFFTFLPHEKYNKFPGKEIETFFVKSGDIFKNA